MPVLIGLLFMFVVNLIHHEYLKYKTLKLEVIIEENFNGEILIFDNIECGQSIQKNNDRYTLYIPKNGILFYSGDLTNEGYIDNIFKQKKGDSLILIPSLNESMFWENSKKYSNHSYTKNTLGVFNVIHYQNHGTKLTPIRKFVLTNKKNLDSINWFKRIQNKLEKIDTIPCNKKSRTT
ncbi:hypothetical protein [uncultured Tenacibaculum sp.]|uniref:hypothetical protein n=1 Tax=uncultured Tenacibaculum sp. TaxID=174713 RepID=UPI00260E8A0A|nr:hypothetical protein [uncultured Tenacibaculum sp.]